MKHDIALKSLVPHDFGIVFYYALVSEISHLHRMVEESRKKYLKIEVHSCSMTENGGYFKIANVNRTKMYNTFFLSCVLKAYSRPS